MPNHPTSASPVRAVLAALNLGTGAFAQAPGTPAAGAPQQLEAYEVTGSRVKRLDYETVAPVVTFTAAAIERGVHVHSAATDANASSPRASGRQAT
jgi:hypothetical protein